MSISTFRFHRIFGRLRAERAALQPFADPPALLDLLHDRQGDLAAKDMILRDLVRAAQQGWSEPASTLLLLALWPGLDAIHRRRLRFFGKEAGLLASELSGRMVEEIARIDPDRVSRTAATLLRNVERDLTRARLAESRIAAGRAEADVERLPADGDASVFGLPGGLDADDACAALASRLRPVLGRDADLLVALEAQGARRQELAEAMGLPVDTVKKRGQRAMARLRAELREVA